MAGMKTIVTLAFFLAIGMLLVILSCALYGQWLPLLVCVTYLLAPIPNFICRRCSGNDDFSSSENNGYLETGYFVTSCFIVSGFGLPLVLAHAGLIQVPAMLLSFFGGLTIYVTVLGYSHFFVEVDDGF